MNALRSLTPEEELQGPPAAKVSRAPIEPVRVMDRKAFVGLAQPPLCGEVPNARGDPLLAPPHVVKAEIGKRERRRC